MPTFSLVSANKRRRPASGPQRARGGLTSLSEAQNKAIVLATKAAAL